jgi:tryptophan-rich sensory protein
MPPSRQGAAKRIAPGVLMNRLASPSQLRASLIRWAVFLVPLMLLLGYGSGMVAGSSDQNGWFTLLEKPAIYPPPAAFGIVWSILYVLMGLAFAGICSSWGSRGRGLAITVFVVQFVLNLAWSPVFFAMHQIDSAFGLIVVMDVLVAICVVLFWRIRRWAGILLLPYLAWILFATVLNWQFWQMNPEAGEVQAPSASQRIEL